MSNTKPFEQPLGRPDVRAVVNEKNGKAIDFDAGTGAPSFVVSAENTVKIGDRFRFTMDAFNYIMSDVNASTVVVVLSEIRIEDDGSKTLFVVPE